MESVTIQRLTPIVGVDNASSISMSSWNDLFLLSSTVLVLKKDVSNPGLRHGRHDMLLGSQAFTGKMI
jgi:hypothetical protein